MAIDTNAILRVLLMDDPWQFEVAQRVFEREDQELVVLPVVLLEVCWTLRQRKWTAQHIAEELRGMFAMSNVVPSGGWDPSFVLDQVEAGEKPGDALITATSGDLPIITFDRDFDCIVPERAVLLSRYETDEPDP